MANQPKAAGSSLLVQLTKYLTVSALHLMHYEFVEEVLLLPLATGMALTMALLTLKEQKPQVRADSNLGKICDLAKDRPEDLPEMHKNSQPLTNRGRIPPKRRRPHHRP